MLLSHLCFLFWELSTSALWWADFINSGPANPTVVCRRCQTLHSATSDRRPGSWRISKSLWQHWCFSETRSSKVVVYHKASATIFLCFLTSSAFSLLNAALAEGLNLVHMSDLSSAFAFGLLLCETPSGYIHRSYYRDKNWLWNQADLEQVSAF